MKTTVSLEDLILMGVDEETAICWFQIRKDKKSRTLTTITLKKIINQGNMLGWDLNRVINKCVEKEWKGFDASWVKNDISQIGQIQQTSKVDFITLHTDRKWREGLQ